jgi:hypothetical protein
VRDTLTVLLIVPVLIAVVAWLILLALLGCTANGHRWEATRNCCGRCGVTAEHMRFGRRRARRVRYEVYGG